MVTLLNTILSGTSLLAQSRLDYQYDPAAEAVGLGFSTIIWLCCCCLIWLPFFVIAYLVYKDAQKNNIDNAMLWALLAFFFPLFGILIYFLVARNNATGANVTTANTAPTQPVEEAQVVREENNNK